MTIRQAIAYGVHTLTGVPDPEVDTLALLSKATGDAPMLLRLHAQVNLTLTQEERFRSLLLLRANREPLQYVLGTQCFYGLEFKVDSRVLIPRQETETLCELALTALVDYGAPRVLDVCTGSGAIAVTLKRMCAKAEVTAVDIDVGALQVATENARNNSAQVRFLQGDLLSPVQGELFDMLVSNPPYIESAACEGLQPEVLAEPRLALDGGADGLDFYRKLALGAPQVLRAGGHMLVEIGDTQAKAVIALLMQTGLLCDVRVHQDLYRADRVISARRAAFPT